MSQKLTINGKEIVLEQFARKGGEVSFTIGKKNYRFRAGRRPDGTLLLEQEIGAGVSRRVPVHVWQSGKDTKRIQVGAAEAKVTEKAVSGGGHTQGASELSPVAPMPGLVRQILVKAGDKVKAGQPLAVMEAMKLQLTLSAGGNGVVEKVLVTVGEMIAEGVELVRLKA